MKATLPPMVWRTGVGLTTANGSGNSSAGSEFASGTTPLPGTVVCPPGSQIDPSNACTDNATGQTVAPIGQLDANGNVVPVQAQAPSFTPPKNSPLTFTTSSTQAKAPGASTATQGSTGTTAPGAATGVAPGATVLNPVVSPAGTTPPDAQVTAPGAAATATTTPAAAIEAAQAQAQAQQAQPTVTGATPSQSSVVVPVALTLVGGALLWWWLA